MNVLLIAPTVLGPSPAEAAGIGRVSPEMVQTALLNWKAWVKRSERIADSP